MTAHPHKSMHKEPVIWEYGEYRITQADDRNLKIFQFKQPTEDWGKKKGGQRKEATWVSLSYHSSLFDALKALIDKVVCGPATVEDIQGMSDAGRISWRIDRLEDALKQDLEGMVRRHMKDRVRI